MIATALQTYEMDEELLRLMAEADDSLTEIGRDGTHLARLTGPDGELRRQETVASHAAIAFDSD